MAPNAPFHANDTIVACATPVGVGAVSIVRLSGAGVRRILQACWQNERIAVDKMASHRMYYGNIVDISVDQAVDDVLVVLFYGPNSYTGEDCAEIHTHGNPAIVDRVVALCCQAGARIAAPGEFTQRAFVNGRLDLAQAEAVAAMISASSDEGVRRAQAQHGGALSQFVRALLAELTTLRAFVEATIDFPEEDIEQLQGAQIAQRLAPLIAQLHTLRATARLARVYHDGARVVLLGPPNAGKSSLFNAWLGEARALVHHVAGTTRDVIEDAVRWDGVLVRLVDTAGVRQVAGSSAPEIVEALGIERTTQMLATADVVVAVLDQSGDLAAQWREVRALLPENIPCVVFWNKSDLVISTNNSDAICGAVTTGAGLDALRTAVLAQLRGSAASEAPSVALTTQRHVVEVDRAIGALSAAQRALAAHDAAEFVAEHFTAASAALGRIVGDVTTDDLLGEIFSRFCIGK